MTAYNQSAFQQFNLDPRIQSAVRALAFSEPTPIQQQAIPAVLKNRDVLGMAQTGTGKTAAFMLPILQRLSRGKLGEIRALVLAPTRELAEQIHQATLDFGKNLRIRSTAIYGGVAKGKQLKVLKSGVDILIACPGRLLDLLGEGHIDLSNIEVFVLDEADRMCDMGFLPDVRRVIRALPARRQNLFFSATMPSDARKLADGILNNPVTVQVDLVAPAKTVSHALYPVSHRLKKELLLHLLDQTATGKVLVFTRTKYRARNLARDLERKDIRAAALQGNMSQNQRQRAMDGFRGSKFDILVATDIAARGIDVSEITHVINFDMPDTVDAYIHRIGRTGRAQESGKALTFSVPDDASMVRAIEKTLGYGIEKRQLEGFNYDEPMRDGKGQAHNNLPSKPEKSRENGAAGNVRRPSRLRGKRYRGRFRN